MIETFIAKDWTRAEGASRLATLRLAHLISSGRVRVARDRTPRQEDPGWRGGGRQGRTRSKLQPEARQEWEAAPTGSEEGLVTPGHSAAPGSGRPRGPRSPTMASRLPDAFFEDAPRALELRASRRTARSRSWRRPTWPMGACHAAESAVRDALDTSAETVPMDVANLTSRTRRQAPGHTARGTLRGAVECDVVCEKS